MAGTLGPRGLTTFGYSIGDNGWGTATNTSLQTLDALCQASVLSVTTTTPPSLASGDAGKMYVIPSGATGAWSGKTAQIAEWSGTAWNYYNPGANTWTNWSVWDYATKLVFVFNGTAWIAQPGQTLSGVYSSRPTAAAIYNGVYFLATDIGISGALFFCNSTPVWKQIDSARLFSATANVAMSAAAEVSIFGTGAGTITLPNGCIGVGTQIAWGFDGLGSGGSGTNSFADVKIKEYIGSTAVGDSGSYAVGIQGTYACAGRGQMICRAVGSGTTGKVMGSGRYEKVLSGATMTVQNIATDTASDVDTTIGISPDVKITLANLVNGPTLTVDNAWMDVSGLV